MARPGSQQIAGYYPTPSTVLRSIASLLTFPAAADPLSAHLLDPCAGDGTAIRTLRDLWAESLPPSDDPPSYWRRPARLAITAAELEEDRATTLAEVLDPTHYSHGDRAFHADAFRLYPEMPATTGATVLFLNPPYDHDPEHRRLEHRFLVRFTAHLHPGAGVLLYLVPHYALEPSADFLARNYLDLRAWRFPDPEFSRFRQILLLGRRARRPLASSTFAATVLRWADDPATLPVLPARCPDPLAIDPEPDPDGYDLHYRLEELDLTAALAAFRPWEGTPTGVAHPVRDLLGARFETAVPPRPAHIALALSSGMFNGHRLEANDPARHPPLLAKGVFERTYLEVSRKVNAEGDTTAIVEIEQLRLRLTILRLDDYTFHTLAPGTLPTGADDLARWNAADLIAGYDRSLAALLARQFPPLHDPQDPAGQIALPCLARKPFRAQDQAIQAALKLLARRRNPFLVAEVGTGKSTMALVVAAALSPAHHPATTAELARTGHPGRLPVVRRTLVVAPPHLLKSWSDQVAAVLPGARVQVLESASDLARPADVYVLSRETAKLGHAWEGIEGRCPRCGEEIPESARTNAARRLRCEAVPRRPADVKARLAVTLATLLAPALPYDPLVASLAAHGVRRRRRPEAPARPLSVARLRDLLDTLDRDHPRAAATLGSAIEALEAPPPAVEGEAAPGEEAPPARSPLRDLRGLLEGLHAAATWTGEAPCGEPLFQAVPRPRRVPLAKRILRRHARDFDLIVLDEIHEMNHAASAQSKAAHRLTGLPGVPTIALTGSLMGGYAGSLFANFWALSTRFRQEFGRDEVSAFVDRYGYRKVETRLDGRGGTRELGSHTDREVGERRTIGEAPGVMPTFLLRHLLPTAVLVHKEDLDVDLPPLIELPAPVEAPADDPLAADLLAEYRRLEEELLTRIRADRFDPDRAGRLLGALVELPSYLDRATGDLEPFEVRYPEALGGEHIATGQVFPAGWRTPKERWLASEVAACLGQGERVLVFLRHTGTEALPRRILRMLREITPRAAWLDARKVPTARREAWIDQHVLDKDVEVLLVNPNAVRTGLNNLVAFSVGLWYELDLSATTYRQANGRLHRIGQTRPVTIRTAYYAGTAQQITFDLVAKKISASLQVDGLDLQAALEAAGASEEHTASLATALSLGQAMYQTLSGGNAGPRIERA